MPQPPTIPVIHRSLVRIIPFTQQKTVAATGGAAPAVAQIAPAGTIVAAFDCGIKSTDPNQLLGGATGANPSADATQAVIGTLLDILVWSSQNGQIVIDLAVDSACSYRSLPTVAVPASTLTNVSGLRITGRFARITYTNNGAAAATVEFGAYVRSS